MPNETAASSSSPTDFVVLDSIEARIIGCLIEKAATTPEVYPLTENALVAACNQKTSRDPILQLEPGAVTHALRVMEGKGLVKVAPASQRARRWEHCFDSRFGVTARQRAVLCVMLLRGPQTLAQLLTRTDRLAEFPGVDDLRDTLDRLIQREPPLAVRLGHAPGQREDRYMHLLCGPVALESDTAETLPTAITTTHNSVAERLQRMESEIEHLRRQLDALQQRFDSQAVGHDVAS